MSNSSSFNNNNNNNPPHQLLNCVIPDEMTVAAPVFGCCDAKTALHDAISLPLTVPSSFLQGIRASGASGILLHGPPGTGKTSLANQASINFSLPLLVVTPGMVVSKWMGDSERNIQNIFDSARSRSPCILFFDELDSIGLSRGDNAEGDSSARRLLAELLIQLSSLLEGEQSKKSVIVIGATNRIEDLDPAIQRRFQKRVFIGNPNQQARVELLTHGFKDIEVDPEVDLADVSSKLEGWSCADVIAVCREAALRPVRRYQKAATAMQKQLQQIAISGKGDQRKEKAMELRLSSVNVGDFEAALLVIIPVHRSVSKLGRTC